MASLFIVLLFCIHLVASSQPVAINVSAVTYILNTSLPASEYLKVPCEEMKNEATTAFTVMLDKIPTEMQPAAFKLAMKFWESGGVIEPYHSEIEYLSKCSGLSIEQLITANIVYDLTAFCTSIVVRTAEGKILHARNQDFPVTLRNDTINLLYVDAENNTLYETTTFFGYVGGYIHIMHISPSSSVLFHHYSGVPTGIKFGSFSVTDNARYDKYGLKVYKCAYVHCLQCRSNCADCEQNWIEIGKTYFPSGWLIRECLIKDTTFDECVHRLSTEKIQAPIYYIIAGLDGSNDGAVITRNQTQVNGPNGSDQVWFLNDTTVYEDWYILETNYDFWRAPFDSRREHAVRMLNEVGQQNISFEALYQILSTPPVLADDTVYTVQMAASNASYYNATIRFDTA